MQRSMCFDEHSVTLHWQETTLLAEDKAYYDPLQIGRHIQGNVDWNVSGKITWLHPIWHLPSSEDELLELDVTDNLLQNLFLWIYVNFIWTQHQNYDTKDVGNDAYDNMK